MSIKKKDLVMNQQFPYQQSIESLEQNYKTDSTTGLTTNEAHERLRFHGTNELAHKAPPSILRIFIRQFESPLIYILLIAAALIIILGNGLDALIISIILFFNALIGTVQEGRTQMLLESLKHFLKSDALVLRNGTQQIIPSSSIVPGDIIILQQGERVPADARLISAHLLIVDESMLTGETIGVNKLTTLLDHEVPVHDQLNMIFKGTYVLSGTATALVTGTGIETEIGKIGSLAQTIREEIPLKKDLDIVSRWVLIFITVSCVFLFIIGLWHGRSINDLLITLSALFICVVPEGLPVVFTLTLVNGAYRMAKEQVVVKQLHAAEGLGRTSLIVIDKTGTLTKNEMMVTTVYSNNSFYTVTGQGYQPKGTVEFNGAVLTSFEHHQTLDLMAQGASLLNRTKIEIDPQTGLFALKGDPTQAALSVFAQKARYEQAHLNTLYSFINEIPFQADLRYQADFYIKDNKLIAFIVAAPEYILAHANNIQPADKEAFEALLHNGLRVIGAAYKEFDPKIISTQTSPDEFKNLIKDDLVFLGFFGLQDTIRPEVPTMVHDARAAGLRIVMATGDHKDTALFVARSVGIFNPGDTVIDGAELKKMSDAQLLNALPTTTVFSRLSPEYKLKLIELYHKMGAVVAMTGDGVNDAPSLVAADIGIAMGIIGTEVAKEVADIILLNDSFASIMNAIAYSKHMFTTLRRVILYFFATNLAELLLILTAVLINFPVLPLVAVQIFWLNLVTDGFLNVALALEDQEDSVFDILRTNKKLSLVDTRLMVKTFYLAAVMAIGSLGIFWYYEPYNITLAQTMTLVTMAMFQWMNAWNCRSETRTNFQLGVMSNRWLVAATTLVLFLQILLVHVPFLQHIFHTVPLSIEQWALIFALTSSIVVIEELRKYFFHSIKQAQR
ncbi:MAG: Calcium-transporting ATPase 1 [Candidatus Dependentiae bacterium ADurb.Bin331]|nr:MAG: Calcium-transporting ATPase 1 [Candidatus Dependentiae bacterium ADurb.Bin331]